MPQSSKSQSIPVLGCIADDVTGATDLATNLVHGGARVVQVLGVPTPEILSQCNGAEVVVVALKSRSIAADEAISQTLQALRQLQELGIERFYFKYCSTFDSTDRGNIGPVAEALMQELQVNQTIFCPAFPPAGRTVYQGHLFVGSQLLNESGMENHPLNPMTDANLIRVLSRQSSQNVGLLSHDTLSKCRGGNIQPISQCLERFADEGVSLIVVDACDEGELNLLASACCTLPLITGGSGLARFLPDAYRAQQWLKSVPWVPKITPPEGRSLILAGSCSNATNQQVEWMKTRSESWAIDVEAILAESGPEMERIVRWAQSSNADRPTLIYSTAPPDLVQGLQRRFGAETVAQSIENFLGLLARTLVNELGYRKLVLAGGETSGAIVRSLGIRLLKIGPEICAGVPWTETMGSSRRLALALKSGNFGAEDFFQKSLEMLA